MKLFSVDPIAQTIHLGQLVKEMRYRAKILAIRLFCTRLKVMVADFYLIA